MRTFTTYHDLDPIRQQLATCGQATPQDIARRMRWSMQRTNATVEYMTAAGLLDQTYLGDQVYISFPRGTAVYTNQFRPVGIAH